jgi:hypothetical protein
MDFLLDMGDKEICMWEFSRAGWTKKALLECPV